MAGDESIPRGFGPTGKERWTRAVAAERVRLEARTIILEATVGARTNMPEYYEWAHDLRRGRTNILGGFFRLVDLMQRRKFLPARRIALRLLDLGRVYVDLMLPDSPAPTPTAELLPEGLRLVGRIARGKAA